VSTTRPSFQFYPGDWLRDTAVRSCSVAARGLWADMLCFMHNGEPYGHLKVKGKVIDEVNLARMAGVNLAETRRLLKELERAGVFDRGPGAVIISRRMVRDEKLRSARAAGGKKGGNPQLLSGGKAGKKDKQEVNLSVEPSAQPSSQQQGYPPPAAAAAEVVVVGVERGVQGGEAVPRSLDYALRCCAAVNGVLDRQLAGGYARLYPNVERPTAAAWQAAGIPIEFAEATLAELAGRFPNGRSKQPNSLGYFTAALHEAWTSGPAATGMPALSPGDRARARAAELEREAAK